MKPVPAIVDIGVAIIIQNICRGSLHDIAPDEDEQNPGRDGIPELFKLGEPVGAGDRPHVRPGHVGRQPDPLRPEPVNLTHGVLILKDLMLL